MFYRSIPMVVAALIVPFAASAQATTGEVQQAICDLGGCAAAAPAPAADDAADDGSVAVGPEKGFHIFGTKPAAAPTQARPAAAPARSPQRVAMVAPAPRQRAAADMHVNFATNADALDDSAKARAQIYAEALKSPALAGARFAIEGHTDSVGSPAANLDLSSRRAGAMATYLVSLGIDPARLTSQGYGDTRPRDGRSPRSADNRRVEIVRLP